MGATKHIKRMLFEKDVKITDLAERTKKPIQSTYNQLNRDSWKFAEVEKIAELYNCDIVFKDRENGKEY